jgi:hypothetical protein
LKAYCERELKRKNMKTWLWLSFCPYKCFIYTSIIILKVSIITK